MSNKSLTQQQAESVTGAGTGRRSTVDLAGAYPGGKLVASKAGEACHAQPGCSTLQFPPAWGTLIVSVLIGVLVIPSVAEHKSKKGTKSNATPLIAAASNCNLDEVNGLLRQGADFKARDDEGRDALTFASLQRTKHLELQCPDVILALTKAGATPSAARFYQSPELTLHQPKEIAVLRVEDIRNSDKRKSVKLKDLISGVEDALSQKRLRMSIHGFAAGGIPVLVAPASYPIMKLSETQRKLMSAGFSEEEVMHPDQKRACSILGTDAVFEAVLKDYGHADIGITTESAASLEYWLTDCRTGELVWRNDPGAVYEERGWIVRGFVGGSFRILCEMGLTLPRYEGSKK